MAGKTKIIPTAFLVYDYDREEEYLNTMSLKGWQLKKGGLFHHTYIQGDQIYRYKLDFNNKVHFNREEAGRYLSIFEDQGWEHVNSTINGWHYFRKEFDPTLEDEEYEIYTDDSSLMEMLGKWIRIARVLQVVLALMTLLYLSMYLTMHSTVYFSEAIMMGLGVALMGLCIKNLKKKRALDKPKGTKSKLLGYALYGAFVLMLLYLLVLIFYQPYVYKLDYSTKITQDTPAFTDELTLKKSGKYVLTVKCNSEYGLVGLQLLKGNKVIYNSGEGGDFEYHSPQLKLKAGTYTVKVLYYPEFYENEDTSHLISEEYSDQDPDESESVDVFVGLKRAQY